MLRKVLIGSGVVLLLLVGAIAYIFHRMEPSIRAAEARIAAEQKTLRPGLIVGAGNFEKHVFYTGNSVGDISQIVVGWPANHEGADITVVGDHGVDFVDSTGEVKKQVRFAIEEHCPIQLVRFDSNGDYGYLTRDESWAVPVTLFDKDGRVRWHYGGWWSGVDDSAAANVSGKRTLSVIVGLNGSGGVVLLNEQGKQVWRRDDGNIWHVEALDANGDGHEEIVHSNAGGQLLVRDANGEVIARYFTGSYVSHFVLTRWGLEAQPTHILVPASESHGNCCKETFVILDAHGKKVTELDSPSGDLFHRYSATPIRFGEGAEYFAVLENNSPSNRSMLLLYGNDGQIAYQEILGESCLGMAAFPKKDGEALLVGCAGKIWEYAQMPRTNNSYPKE